MNEQKMIRVAGIGDISENSSLCVSAEGLELSLFYVNGKYFVTANACPHAGGPLCEGSIETDVITCPWHGSKFNIETGEVMNGPASVAVKTYPTEVRDGDIYITL